MNQRLEQDREVGLGDQERPAILSPAGIFLRNHLVPVVAVGIHHGLIHVGRQRHRYRFERLPDLDPLTMTHCSSLTKSIPTRGAPGCRTRSTYVPRRTRLGTS